MIRHICIRHILLILVTVVYLRCLVEADSISDQIKQLESELNRQKVYDAIQELQEILNAGGGNYTHNSQKDSSKKNYVISDEEPAKFDFIIVGGGRCGTVVANRLSENPDFTTLLLEEGCDTSPLSSIPGLSSYTFFKNYTKIYKMKPQSNFGLGLKNNTVVIASGVGLGGTSNICNVKLSRGHKTNFLNMPNWCYDTVLPYFTKSEKCKINENKKVSAYHNFDGVLHHSDSSQSNVSSAFLQCACEQGDEEIDAFGDFNVGVTKVQTATKDGFRQSHRDAFFDPISNRENLQWYCNSTVIQVLIDDTKTAYGVKYVKDGVLYTALANREVILCAGVYENPRILFFSGIGPKRDLEKNNITCIQDLPVGECVRDNIAYEGLIFTTNDTAVPSTIDDVVNEETIDQLLNNGTGYLASPNGLEAVRYIKVNSMTPNVVVSLYNRYYTLDGGRALPQTISLSDETYQWMKELEGKRIFQLKPILSAKSCGRIKLVSNSFWEDLEITGNYFQNKQDKKNIIGSIITVLNFAKCNAFTDLGIIHWDKPYPKCKDKLNLNDYLNCVVEYLTISNEAPMGSCRLGTVTDQRAVVDENLKVIGIKNLRCGGDSIIPGPFLGNIHLITTMVSERLADLIKIEAGSVPVKYCPTVDQESSEEFSESCDSEERNPKLKEFLRSYKFSQQKYH